MITPHSAFGPVCALDREDLDQIWTEAARRLGFRVDRSADAYASSDGAGTIVIGSRETLDPEDSVAQLVFHELCHALVQGEQNLTRPDWGLDNTTDADGVRENACLRVQAHLASAHGVRAAMTPTTVTRPYYQALGADALAPTDAAEPLARTALHTTLAQRFVPIIDQALHATARTLVADVDCQTCGACCRHAFDRVSVAMRDTVVWKHPELVLRTGPQFWMDRQGDRCVALDESPGDGDARWSCRIYEARPRTCNEFEQGSRKCIAARTRVGLGL